MSNKRSFSVGKTVIARYGLYIIQESEEERQHTTLECKNWIRAESSLFLNQKALDL